MGVKAYLAILRTKIIRQEYEIQGLQILTENTAKMIHGEAKYLSIGWTEVGEKKPDDNKTAEEITNDVVAKAGLTVKKSE